MTISAALYTERRPAVVLPTLPGLAHGIVSKGPYEVQCDGCLVVRGGNAPNHKGFQIIFADMLFNPRLSESGDRRRLCRDCRGIHWEGYEE